MISSPPPRETAVTGRRQDRVDVATLLDRPDLGGMRIRIITLCALAALLDGLDVQVIGVAAPALARSLGLSLQSFGPVFGATLLGLALGAATFGACSDRIGRKRVLLIALTALGVFTLMTAFVTSLQQLLLVRFLAGIGLGGAMPNFIGMASDYAPRQRRQMLVSLLWTGFPIGGMIGGLLAARLIDAFGWRTLFYIGGVLPLLLAATIAFAVPESLVFLVRRNGDERLVRRAVSALWPEMPLDGNTRFVIGRAEPPGISIRALFSQGQAAATLLLWLSFFSVFLLLITIVVWSPSLLQAAGIEPAVTALILVGFNLGSVIGTPLGGGLVSARGPRPVLVILLLACSVVLAASGLAISSVALMFLSQTLVGLLLGAGSAALIAVSAQIYPARARASGIGCAMAAGRLGSFAGPVVVGGLVGTGWSIAAIFTLLSLPALCAAGCVALIAGQARAAELETATLETTR